MMPFHRWLLPWAACAPTLLSSQSATIVVENFAPMPGVGNLTTVGPFVVTDEGDWLVLYDTDFPGEEQDGVLLRNGVLDLREGHPLVLPAGASIGEFGSLNLDARGRTAWGLQLDGPGSGADSGLYLNTQLLLQEGFTIFGAGIPTGTVLGEMGDAGSVLMNAAGTILMGVQIEDPTVALPPPFEAALLLVETDPAGNVLSIESLARKEATNGGNILFRNIELGASATRTTKLDLNDAGDVLFSALIRESGIGTTAVFLNDQVLFREGDPGPLANTTWRDLFGVTLDLNDAGEVAVLASVFDSVAGGSRQVIATRNGLAIDFGLPFAPTAPLPTAPIAEAPVRISNQGDVFCRIDWPGFLTARKGIRVNEELPVRQGTTEVEGLPMQALLNDFAVSPSGRYLLFEATNGVEGGLCLMDLGLVEVLDDCSGNPSDLRRSAGFPVSGETVSLALDDGQLVGALSFLVVTEGTVPGYPPCGIPLGTRELVIDLFSQPPLLVAQGAPWVSAPVEIGVPILANPLLVDRTFYAQGMFLGSSPFGPSVFLTNAIALTIGAP